MAAAIHDCAHPLRTLLEGTNINIEETDLVRVENALFLSI